MKHRVTSDLRRKLICCIKQLEYNVSDKDAIESIRATLRPELAVPLEAVSENIVLDWVEGLWTELVEAKLIRFKILDFLYRRHSDQHQWTRKDILIRMVSDIHNMRVRGDGWELLVDYGE